MKNKEFRIPFYLTMFVTLKVKVKEGKGTQGHEIEHSFFLYAHNESALDEMD